MEKIGGDVGFMLDSCKDRNGNNAKKSGQTDNAQQMYQFQFKDIVWRNVIAFVYLHVATLYAFYLIFSGQVKWTTIILGYFTAGFAALGVTAGAHRLWTHNGYKAKWQLKVLWIYLNSMAFQNCVWEWARDHRAHHKFTDTDGDPHNYKRGFFFAHMGWLMLKKHPEVKRKGAMIDMSDLERDPFVMFQKKYYFLLMPIIGFVIPTYFCHYVTGDSLSTSWYICGILKYTMSLHWAWLVNSAAHVWGSKPYDKGINPSDNRLVALITNGEGWHNYHHVFPWDYKAAELHTYGLNLCTAFIDFFALFGWAYDLRTVSDSMVRARALRTGDGTHPSDKANRSSRDNGPVEHVWGWNDNDMTDADKRGADIRNQSKKIRPALG